MSASLQLARFARFATSRFTFKKKLPAAFGGARIYVTARSDVRLLAPGFARTAADLLQVAGAYVKPGDCVWDIGSNLGIFSFCAAWKAGPKGQVFSLEADPYYADLQHRSSRGLAANYASVAPLCAAVADHSGILQLAVPKRGHSRNHLQIVGGNDPGETETVKQVVAVTGEFLLAHWPKPDFVKVDVEGAELLFFEGAPSILSTTRPSFYLEVSDSTCDAITSLLRSHNYRLSRLSADGVAIPIERCDFNTLAQPAEKT